MIASLRWLLALAIGSATCQAALAERPLEVFVSIPPEEAFVAAIGGEHVRVESLVRPGFDPHSYEPSPSQIQRLADADLYFGIGMPFELSWMPRIRAVNPDLRTVDLARAILPEGPPGPGGEALHRNEGAEEDHGHQGEHGHGADLDPHSWTDPSRARQMAVEIARALIAADPVNRDDYDAGLDRLTADLTQLDEDIRAMLAGRAGTAFIVSHPAWGYFAEAYGLEQIAIEQGGKEPGPRGLAMLIDDAKRRGIEVVFVQPQSGQQAARQVARAIGARVQVLDSLAPDYFDNLRQAARAIADARGGPEAGR